MRKKFSLLIRVTFHMPIEKVLKHFSKADVKEYDGKILSKKLNQCIQKAYCQCDQQRIYK